jgi:hypothetical protein
VQHSSIFLDSGCSGQSEEYNELIYLFEVLQATVTHGWSIPHFVPVFGDHPKYSLLFGPWYNKAIHVNEIISSAVCVFVIRFGFTCIHIFHGACLITDIGVCCPIFLIASSKLSYL